MKIVIYTFYILFVLLIGFTLLALPVWEKSKQKKFNRSCYYNEIKILEGEISGDWHTLNYKSYLKSQLWLLKKNWQNQPEKFTYGEYYKLLEKM